MWFRAPQCGIVDAGFVRVGMEMLVLEVKSWVDIRKMYLPGIRMLYTQP